MNQAPQPKPLAPAAKQGRLQARPTPPTRKVAYGIQALNLAVKDALLYVPAGYRPDQPAPLAVMLHGAGGTAAQGLALLQGLADELGLLLLAPAACQYTWDIMMDDYGPDIAFIDEALAATFTRCAVDPARIAIGGFSDGASYALSVGMMNRDCFSHIIAFSPGFMAPLIQRGKPQIYLSHGTLDEVLPIYRCSRQLVPQLLENGYEVRYQEFEGPHTVPMALTREAAQWFVGA